MPEISNPATGDSGESARWLTTGEAAELCGVARDTVLRWIKVGKLEAERTPGGHHRIPIEAVEKLVIPAVEAQLREPSSRRPLYCWEYFIRDEEPPEECRGCIVYRARAEWCFRLAGNPECGHALRYFRGSCEQCPYYRRIHRLPANVLVITTDPVFAEQLRRGTVPEVVCHFAANAYEASAVVETFRPEFAVVDCSLPNGERGELLRCLAGDNRVPGLRVILAVRSLAAPPQECSRHHGLLAGVLRKPFGPEAIRSLIEKIPVPAPPAGETDPASPPSSDGPTGSPESGKT